MERAALRIRYQLLNRIMQAELSALAIHLRQYFLDDLKISLRVTEA